MQVGTLAEQLSRHTDCEHPGGDRQLCQLASELLMWVTPQKNGHGVFRPGQAGEVDLPGRAGSGETLAGLVHVYRRSQPQAIAALNTLEGIGVRGNDLLGQCQLSTLFDGEEIEISKTCREPQQQRFHIQATGRHFQPSRLAPGSQLPPEIDFKAGGQ